MRIANRSNHDIGINFLEIAQAKRDEAVPNHLRELHHYFPPSKELKPSSFSGDKS
jgi:hypothetical protein